MRNLTAEICSVWKISIEWNVVYFDSPFLKSVFKSKNQNCMSIHLTINRPNKITATPKKKGCILMKIGCMFRMGVKSWQTRVQECRVHFFYPMSEDPFFLGIAVLWFGRFSFILVRWIDILFWFLDLNTDFKKGLSK